MKIGLIFQDSGFRGVDLKNPDDGNPGIGGTQFCFIMLAKYLKTSYPEIDVHIFHFSENIFPVGIQSHIVSNEYEAICMA
ncbi:hypothetical protein SDC9_128071 [bioreactor metagenome]|uniref:Uncharacterized protein n=1 Tax=bioreactor metagenome TaxID=1076179 RepID=A0A645CV37_9ZZZZ